MAEKVTIFGKNTWPHTNAAREAYKKQGKEVNYVQVLSDPEQMKIMLIYSGGARRVPVIVEGDDIIIGFEGKT